jgi:ABC-type lipoprotein export system ATPase subunit
MSALRASGLVKSYGPARAARRILDGASLEVARGELVAVVGRSGSGKSTLLHLLGGLDWPEEGWVEVGGERLIARDADHIRARRVGFVFQAFHLVPELTGLENVLLAARVPGAAPQTAQRGTELVERLGLAPVSSALPHELSGGEQQRFAIARALAGDPDVVLADEPTGNLDAASGRLVLDLLRAATEAGRAVVVVTHEPEATGRADRVLELRDGRLVP